MRLSLALAVLSAAGVLGFGSAALANHTPAFGLEVLIDGALAGTYNEDDLDCNSTGGDTFQCASTGPGVEMGGTYGMRMDSWSLTLDADPVVSGITAVTNLSGSTQQFTLIFTLPTSVLPASLMGGSIQGGMTDINGDGVTLSVPTGSAFYTALTDTINVQQTLYPDTTPAFTAGGYLSGNVPTLAWGTPIPSAAGPAVTTNIRIQLDFLLSGNDSASFTSNFVVIPVPEPGTGLLLAGGLFALALQRRR